MKKKKIILIGLVCLLLVAMLVDNLKLLSSLDKPQTVKAKRVTEQKVR
ncbi:hypothetical protein [Flavisolibacter tropicus]|nr:hypothetical protein [Flavisolibacter tropicus]